MPFRIHPAFSLVVAAALLLLAGCGGGTSTPPGNPQPTTFQLTVTGPTSGTGTVTSTPAGINCPSTCTATFAQNTSVALTETPATGYMFSGWGGACTGTGACAMTINAATAVTATFAQAAVPQLTVTLSGTGTVTSTPAGINCPSNCSAGFAQGTGVTLTETPGAGFTFSGWGGACSGTGACTITISGATAVTASFAQTPPPQLTVAVSGSGSVTSNPAGINCPGTCSASFAQNTQVTLTESPNAGYVFAGWGGVCANHATTCTVTLSGATSVTAAFSLPLASQLTVTISGNGSVTSSPAGINCPGTCSANFTQNSQVTLTATPGSGFGLGAWTGSCSGNTSPCTFTITSPSSVTATFTQLGTVTVSLIGVGSGTVASSPTGINCPGTCNASFPNNTVVTLTATPDAKSTFAGWTGVCAGMGTCSVTVTNSTADAATAAFGLTLQSAINHIIYLAQENRSFDHYFGALAQYWQDDNYVHYKNQPFNGLPQFPTNAPSGPASTNPGCDPAYPFVPPAQLGMPWQDCVYDAAAPVTSYHLQTMCVENPSPSWNESHVDMNYNDPTLGATGKATLDGFVWSNAHDSRYPIQNANGTITSQFMDTNGVRTMGYYDGSDLNYYYFMASNFAISDTWFSPVMSRTTPNREYLIGATSYGFAYPNGTDAADNMQIPSEPIFEELQNAGITWKLYVYPDPNPGTYGTLSCAANDTRPECLYQISYLHTYAYGQTIIGSPTLKQNIVPISQFYADAAAGTLPQVAQIEPASAKGLDEHAADFDPTPQQPTPCCSVQAGAAFVKTLIDAVMGTPSNPGPSWKDSVFILTYDEYGGFYDHVAPYTPMPPPDNFTSPVDLFQGPPPAGAPGPDVCVKVGGPTCQFQYTGYRVPLIVVSPFTKQNFVSHAPADYTAILKFIEDRFSLNPLTARDSFQLHMGTEFLDLVNEPWKTPPTPPAQNTAGPCYLDHLP